MIGTLNERETEELLKQHVFGHLGCNDGFNTYVYPINYVYDGTSVIFHSQKGFKLEVMRQNKRVCLQVESIVDSNHWKSVMLLGEFYEIDNERERYAAVKSLNENNLHLKISDSSLTTLDLYVPKTSQTHILNRSAIYRILPDEKSGRFENIAD